jgi:hypothetical protein
LPGDLTVLSSDDLDMTLVAWLLGEGGAPGVLYGRVVGENAKGVAGAAVLVEGSDLSATTLPDGWYALAVPESATWSLSAELDGLGAGSLQVDAFAGEITQAPALRMASIDKVASEVPPAEEAVATYWGLVDDGRYDAAWTLLSPSFQNERFGGDAEAYRQHYAEMELCRVVPEDVRQLESDAASAVVAARMLYETGRRCQQDAFEFDFHFVYDADGAAWLLDDIVWQGVSRRTGG